VRRVPTASTKPVYQKLGLKPAHRACLLRLPAGMDKKLGKAPEGVTFAKTLSGELDLVLGFYETAKALKGDLPKLHKTLASSGAAWACWRKGNVTDLSRDLIAALADEAGLEGVASCAIDDDWSALKLMRPKSER
jgi:hypothetical protein